MKVCHKCGANERAPSSAYCRSCRNEYARNRPRARQYASTPEFKARHKAYIAGRRQTIAGVASALMNKARTRAKAKKLPVTITREWVIEQLSKPCPLTGRTFDLSTGSQRRKPNAPSLDQIEAGKGYLPGNVRVIVSHANLALSEFGDAALMALVNDIHGQLAAKPR